MNWRATRTIGLRVTGIINRVPPTGVLRVAKDAMASASRSPKPRVSIHFGAALNPSPGEMRSFAAIYDALVRVVGAVPLLRVKVIAVVVPSSLNVVRVTPLIAISAMADQIM